MKIVIVALLSILIIPSRAAELTRQMVLSVEGKTPLLIIKALSRVIVVQDRNVVVLKLPKQQVAEWAKIANEFDGKTCRLAYKDMTYEFRMTSRSSGESLPLFFKDTSGKQQWVEALRDMPIVE